MYRILIELLDGTELEIRRRSPPIINATIVDEPSCVRPALARCGAPEPRLTTQRQMRGRLRRVA